MSLQPALDTTNDKTLVLFILLWQVQQACQVHNVRGEQFAGVSLGPQDGRVVAGVAISVLHGCLCLADAAQTTDRLWWCQAAQPPGFVSNSGVCAGCSVVDWGSPCPSFSQVGSFLPPSLLLPFPRRVHATMLFAQERQSEVHSSP